MNFILNGYEQLFLNNGQIAAGMLGHDHRHRRQLRLDHQLRRDRSRPVRHAFRCRGVRQLRHHIRGRPRLRLRLAQRLCLWRARGEQRRFRQLRGHCQQRMVLDRQLLGRGLQHVHEPLAPQSPITALLVLTQASLTNDGVIANNGGAALDVEASELDNAGGLTNHGLLSVNGSSTLLNYATLTNAAGATLTVSAGGVLRNYDAVINDGSFTICANGTAWIEGCTLTGNVVVNGDLWLSTQYTAGADMTYSGDISGSGEVLSVAYNTNCMIFAGDNSGFTGTFDLYCGTTQAGSANALGDSNVQGGGNLDLAGFSLSINSVNLWCGTVTNSGSTLATLKLTGDNPSSGFTNEILCDGNAPLGLQIATPGEDCLNWENTQMTATGGTTIDAGTLLQLGYGERPQL